MVFNSEKRKNKNTSNPIIKMKSSEILSHFLKKSHLHKRDFAQMIGVTLSYVYNLIDEAIPFSGRSTTLERIAAVMDVEPEVFKEYKIPQEPVIIDEATEFIKSVLKDKKIPPYQFLKSFPRKKRVEIVDILRGAAPIPADWQELQTISRILNIKTEDIYPYWENRVKQILSNSGINLQSNSSLINTMFGCAKDYIYLNCTK